MTKSKFDQSALFKLGLRGCISCKGIKGVSEFSSNPTNRQGLSNLCKPCNSLKSRAYYEINKQKVLARESIYAQLNSDKIKTYKKEWYEKNIEKIRENAAKNRDHKKRITAIWLDNNPNMKNRERKRTLIAQKKRVANLDVTYVRKLITRQYEIERCDIPPELIELKHREIQIRRTRKQIINQIKNQNHDR